MFGCWNAAPSPFQWAMLYQNSSLWPIPLQWPYMAWLIASLNYSSPYTTRLWSMKQSQSSFQSQRRAMPKNVQTTILLCSFHMLARLWKILQVRLQQYMHQELSVVESGFQRVRWNQDQIANICWIMEKAREFQKNIYFCFMDYVKAFDCMDHNKLWEILKEMGISDHFRCLLRNAHAGQDATVRTEHGTMDWFKIGKGVWQGCILSPWLFNLYSGYIMWNARPDESQAGIKISRRNINYRYADDTTLRGEIKEELKSLFNLHVEYIMWNAGLDESQAGIKISVRNMQRYQSNGRSEEEFNSPKWRGTRVSWWGKRGE